MNDNAFSELERECSEKSTVAIIQMMDELRAVKDDLEERLKKVNLNYDFLRLTVIPKRFEDEGIEGLKVEGIGRVSLTGDMHVSIPVENRDAAYEWFRDIGKSSLITETINSSTLKAAVKSMIRAGEEVPENLIKVTPFTRASIAKR